MLLGREYTAAQIYTLYRCMRIVVVKRRKHKSGGHSSLGSAVAGLAAGRVMRLHKDWKRLLIEEYATLQGQDVPAPGNVSACHKMFKAAVQYVHVNLLQDLSPPWIDHARGWNVGSVPQADLLVLAGRLRANPFWAGRRPGVD